MTQIEGKCPSNGNSGFPIIISGVFSQNTLDNIKFDTSIRISSSPRSIPRTLSKESGFIDELGGDILYYGSTTYSLISLQLAKSYSTQLQSPQQQGPATIQLYAIFKKKLESAINEQFIIVNIPIINAASTEENKFNENVTKYMDELITPDTKTPSKFDILFENQKSCIEYITCIEAKDINKSKTITFRVLNLNGHIINDKVWEKIKVYFNHTFPSFKLPKSIGFKSIAFKKSISDSNELIISEWSEEGYVYNNLVSAGSDDLKKRFIFNSLGITNSNFEKRSSNLQQTSQKTDSSLNNPKSTDEYRCMPLDVDKDIENNKVLLDPSTATRLSTDIESDVNAYNAELSTDYKQLSMNRIKKIIITISIVIASILGVIAASFVVNYIYKWFKSDKTSGSNNSSNSSNSNISSNSSSSNNSNGGISSGTIKSTAPVEAPNAAAVTAPVAAPVTAPNAAAVTASVTAPNAANAAAVTAPVTAPNAARIKPNVIRSNITNNLKFPNVPTYKISSPLSKQIAIPVNN